VKFDEQAAAVAPQPADQQEQEEIPAAAEQPRCGLHWPDECPAGDYNHVVRR
jgi:hypothetical protein